MRPQNVLFFPFHWEKNYAACHILNHRQKNKRKSWKSMKYVNCQDGGSYSITAVATSGFLRCGGGIKNGIGDIPGWKTISLPPPPNLIRYQQQFFYSLQREETHCGYMKKGTYDCSISRQKKWQKSCFISKTLFFVKKQPAVGIRRWCVINERISCLGATTHPRWCGD